MKLGWLSDIHLDFLSLAARKRFYDDLSKRDVDGWCYVPRSLKGSVPTYPG